MNLLKRALRGRLFLYLTFISLSIFTSCNQQKEKQAAPTPAPTTPAPEPENPSECLTKASADNGSVIQGQYIIKYRQTDGMQANSAPSFVKRLGLNQQKFHQIFKGNNFHAAVAGLNHEQVSALRQDASVEAIEPDRVISITSCATSIPSQSAPWGVERVGGGDATGKTVWIIDTGVDLDHPDINVDASRCISFIAGTTPDDDHGHGSHVAGIIAAKNNAIGVLGVAANATVVALKVMDASGKGSSSTVVQAVNYVSLHAKAGDVVNMSIGGDVSDILDQAVKDAAGKGILFAIAAGNEHAEVSTSSPGRVNHANVFTVSAVNNEDTYADFSNYGAGIDFAAPGVNIASTYKNGGYATMSGTSMATPHVAGLLLLKGRNILKDGFAKEDPDGTPDPIAHK